MGFAAGKLECASSRRYNLWTGSPGENQNAIEARQRKMINVDMDAFYASIEQQDNPDLVKA